MSIIITLLILIAALTASLYAAYGADLTNPYHALDERIAERQWIAWATQLLAEDQR